MVVKFKKYLLVALACFFIVILTFTLGTFNPNFIKIKELEQKLETKIVSRLTTIDFYPPVFDITDEINFAFQTVPGRDDISPLGILTFQANPNLEL